jgi:hypothetical protein
MQVPGPDGELLGAEQPALRERGDALHAGQQLMGLQARGTNRLGLVAVLASPRGQVARPPVADDDCPGLLTAQQAATTLRSRPR